jgi:hypothetical protein
MGKSVVISIEYKVRKREDKVRKISLKLKREVEDKMRYTSIRR